jgi:outer membrane immunogenic protein
MSRNLCTPALALVAALVSSAACAADLPSTKAPPAFVASPISWTGFYAGVNIGYTFASDPGYSQSLRIEDGRITPNSEVFRVQGPAFDGVSGGLQIGYNHQWDIWVLGLEADFHGADVNGQSQGSGIWIAGFNGPLAAQLRQSLDWYGSVRARVGATPFDKSLLLYVTGGFAYGLANHGVNFYDSDGDFGALNSASFQTGFTVGAGAEWQFMPGWSAKIEYLYTDLGAAPRLNLFELQQGVDQFTLPNQWKTFNTPADRFHTVRVGLNYHFNLFGGAGPVVAKY